MPSEKKLLSEPEVNAHFFNALKQVKPILEARTNYHQASLGTWDAELSLVNECFTFVVTDIVSIKEIMEDIDLTHDCPNFARDLDDALNDSAHTLGYEFSPKGLLLDEDDSKSLYLNKRVRASEFHIIGDKALLRATVDFNLTGMDYNTLFDKVDLTKFASRNYDTSLMDTSEVKNRSDCPVIVRYYGNNIHVQDKVDMNLLTAWMKFQFFKQLFPVTFDPFFEKDGLLHQKTKTYGELAPEYTVPSNMENMYHSNAQMKLKRKYNDSEDFL